MFFFTEEAKETFLDFSKGTVNPISGWVFQWLLTDAHMMVPKICHTYPTIMKLGTVITYLKKIQKLYKSHDAPLDFW